MPANRSRTLEWRRCLRQVMERGGALEIAIAHTHSQSRAGSHLVWRVRLLDISDSEITVEQPSALGQVMQFDQGIELLAILAIGQNRWTFATHILGAASPSGSERRGPPSLRLSMPGAVQRCQRRTHYRVDTGPLTLPQVEVWPLLDPKSVLLAERAYEIQHELDLGEKAGAKPVAPMDHEAVMPEVGPRFVAMLLNLGGGGVGLRVAPEDGQAITRHKLFWMRMSLEPALTAPICASGKVVHTHMESTHDTYAGLAFDFSFNPAHQRFVVDQICRYIALQQRLQMHGAPAAERRTA